MKRFLMYIVVAVVLVFCGLSVYYVVRNDERVYETSATTKTIYMNIGEEISIPAIYEDPSRETKMTVASDDSYVVSVNKEEWTLTALNAGVATIKIETTNENMKTLEFSLNVGNGSIEHPYYLRNEADLRKAGRGEWTLYENYLLVEDIELTQSWTPIGNFSEPFAGNFSGGSNYHTISNIVVDENSNWPNGHVGFFGATSTTAKIENIIFDGVKINGTYAYLGAVVGMNSGLVGKVIVRNAELINDYNDGCTGGVVGLNKTANDTYAQINLCTTENVVMDSACVAGGLVGFNKAGIIYNSEAHTSSVTIRPAEADKDKSYFGGLVGISTSILAGVNNCQSLHPAIMANSLARIDRIVNSGARCGGISGYLFTSNESIDEYGIYSMLLYMYATSIPANVVVVKDHIIAETSNAVNYAKRISNEQRLTKSTYKKTSSSWDLTNIWTLEAGVSMGIDYSKVELDYQKLPLTGQVITIENKTQLEEAFANMRLNPIASVTYSVVESITYSARNIVWEPIGGSTNPFMGRFEVAEGKRVTITGLNVEHRKYAGIFGCVSGNNAYISGIEVRGVVNGACAGGIVGYNNGATIENCRANGLTINTTKYAGAIAGYNSGRINGTIIPKDTEEGDPIIEDTAEGVTIQLIPSIPEEKNIYFGGIAGYNIGKLEMCSVNGLSIDGSVAMTENTLFVGGIAGFAKECEIKYCKTLGEMTALATTNQSKVYFGGIVGYIAKVTISESGSGASGDIVFKDTDTYCGGVVGYMDAESIVEKTSIFGALGITGYSLGGITAFSSGKITESFVGEGLLLNGVYVGGLVCNLYGTIDNSYTLCTLNGSAIQAGMATFLWKGSIDKSFTYCSYTENEGSESWADTSVSYIVRGDLYGAITNSILVAKAKPIEPVYDTSKPILNEDGSARVDEAGNPLYEQKVDKNGNLVFTEDELESSKGSHTIKSKDGVVNVKYQTGNFGAKNEGCEVCSYNQAINSSFEIYKTREYDDTIWNLVPGENEDLPKLIRAYGPAEEVIEESVGA